MAENVKRDLELKHMHEVEQLKLDMTELVKRQTEEDTKHRHGHKWRMRQRHWESRNKRPDRRQRPQKPQISIPTLLDSSL